MSQYKESLNTSNNSDKKKDIDHSMTVIIVFIRVNSFFDLS